MFWCGKELQKQRHVFTSNISRSRDDRPTKRGIISVSVSFRRRGFLCQIQGMRPVLCPSQSSRDVLSPDHESL